MHDHSDFIFILLCIAAFGFFVILYFIPTLVALFKRRPLKSVFLLNLLAGWTAIGWVAALIWALLPNQQFILMSSYTKENERSKKSSKIIDM